MNIVFERNALLPDLAQLRAVTERKITIPILAHCLMVARDGEVSITTTDLDIWLTARIPADVGIGGGGTITLPVEDLHDIARKTAEGGQIALSLEGEVMVIRAGRARWKLPTLPATDWPELSFVSGFAEAAALPAPMLARLMGEPSHAICTEATRYYLGGICLQRAPGPDGVDAVFAVATNGAALHRLALPLPDAVPGGWLAASPILPTKACQRIGAMAEAAGKGEVLLGLGEGRVTAEGAGWRLAAKLIDGTFPDWRRVIPTSQDKAASFDAEHFAAALERVAGFASGKGGSVRLDLDDGKATLTTRADGREAQDELTCDYEGEPFTIGFAPQLMQGVLKALDADTITLRMSDAGSPILIETRPDAPALCIVMPMRV